MYKVVIRINWAADPVNCGVGCVSLELQDTKVIYASSWTRGDEGI